MWSLKSWILFDQKASGMKMSKLFLFFSEPINQSMSEMYLGAISCLHPPASAGTMALSLLD